MKNSIVKQGLLGLSICVFFVMSIGVATFSEMKSVLTHEIPETFPGSPSGNATVSIFENGILVSTSAYHLSATKKGAVLQPANSDAIWGIQFLDLTNTNSRVNYNPVMAAPGRILIPHANFVEDIKVGPMGFKHSLIIPSLPIYHKNEVFMVEGTVFSTSDGTVDSHGRWNWDLDTTMLSLAPYRVRDASGNMLPATVALDGTTVSIVIPSESLVKADFPVTIY